MAKDSARDIVTVRGDIFRIVKQTSYEVTKDGRWINPLPVTRFFLFRRKKTGRKKGRK